jgi:hypothetical protein
MNGMKNSDMWRLQYKNNRYMSILSTEELEKRCNDILCNLTILSPKGQISFREINAEGKYWLVAWTHVLEEFFLRYGPYPNGFKSGFVKNADMVSPTFPAQPMSKAAIDTIGGVPNLALYKFGKYKYLIESLKKGRFRIAPASIYNDPSLNNAVRDDELSFTISKRTMGVKFRGTQNSLKTFGRLDKKLVSNTNYYVICFATDYTLREYDDFEADACLVIKEPTRFIGDLLRVVDDRLSGFSSSASSVKYVDPLNCEESGIDLFMCKHFKYTYQNEYRAIWVPKTPTADLDVLNVDLGSLESYVELLRI